MATVHHPNLCPIHDIGEHDGRPYLTMAYIDGKSLSEQLANDGAMARDEAVLLVRKLALAIHAAHEAGVLHRDLKPFNVMFDHNGEPFITDFGLASRDRQTEADLTQSGTVIGSPAYMAPEQVDGRRQAMGPFTDVYSLGVILYELLCGRRPFEGSGLAVLGQITSGKLPAPLSALANVDKRLEAVCLRAMAQNSAARFQSAAELADALKVPHAPRLVQSRQSRKTVIKIAVSLVTLSLISVAVLLFALSGKNDSTSPSRPKPDVVDKRERPFDVGWPDACLRIGSRGGTWV